MTVDQLVAKMLDWYRLVGGKRGPNPRFAAECERRWTANMREYFDGMRVERLDDGQLLGYRKQRAEQGAAPSTIYRELFILGKAFRLGKVRPMPEFAVAMSSEDGNARKVFISEADKAKLREVARNDTGKAQGARMRGIHSRVFVELLFSYGWRK